MKKLVIGLAEFFPYFSAALLFFLLRYPLLPFWWADFHSDFAVVGLMAEHTKAGHFPIYFYGQNYMGGLEWLTAAFLSWIFEAGAAVSMEVLRVNSLLWWFAAWLVWARALRLVSLPLSQLVAWLIAFGTLPLLQVSVLQELSPQAIFFGGLIFTISWRGSLLGRHGFLMGLVLGLAWWTNQSVIFFLLPAVAVFRAFPENWHRGPLLERMLSFPRRLCGLYLFASLLVLVGVCIALVGGISLKLGSISLKIPNGISLARDTFLGIFLLQLGRASWALYGEKRLRAGFSPLLPAVLGFLVGFSPVWLGRLLGLYEKSYGVGLAILPAREWEGQARSLVAALFEILFSGQWLLGATYFIAIGLGLRFGQWRGSSILRFSIFVFLLNIFYGMFAARSIGVPIRYLYPSFFALLIFTSTLVLSIRISKLRNGLVVALMLASAYGSLRSRNYLLERAQDLRWRKVNLESVQKILEGSGSRYCWGDYWTSYLFTYLSSGANIISPHPDSSASQVRIKTDFEAVARANPACYLFREGESANAKVFFSDQNPWGKK